MLTLLSLKPLLINPLQIYKYEKVILNDSMYDIVPVNVNFTIFKYLYLIIKKDNKKYLKSFKYFITICENIEFHFTNFYDYTLIEIIIFIICRVNKLVNVYNKNLKKILIYIIKKYKSLEYYSTNNMNILFIYSLNTKKICLKIYKYLLSLNIYYKKYNTYYETPYNNTMENKLIKIKQQQEIWRSRKVFILLCIL